MADQIVRNLNKPFADVWNTLDMKAQRKAMRGAMRREANYVRKAARQAMDESGLGKGTKQPISKSIMVRVYPARYNLGFMITTIPHGKKGYHTNKYGKEKPVAMWAETGTAHRNVGKRKHGVKGISRTGRKARYYTRSGHSTGQMPAYRFMGKAEEATANGVEERLFRNLEANVDKAARKNGLL